MLIKLVAFNLSGSSPQSHMMPVALIVQPLIMIGGLLAQLLLGLMINPVLCTTSRFLGRKVVDPREPSALGQSSPSISIIFWDVRELKFPGTFYG
jgi:hypothetical protein